MTKLQMINLAIDLSYIQGRIFDKEGAMTDCQDLLDNAIDTLVEEIEHQPGCSDCVYFGSERDIESPCNICSRRHKDKHETKAEGEKK